MSGKFWRKGEEAMAKCPDCGGKGGSYAGHDTYQHCSTCGGRGQVSEEGRREAIETWKQRTKEREERTPRAPAI